MQKNIKPGKPNGLPKFKLNNFPLVSIIIPCYNSAQTLEDCLASVLGQTYKNLEIICINNGSTDNTAQILKSCQAQDNRIIMLQKPHGTVGSARAEGYRASTGEFIAFVDADDTLNKFAISKLMQALVAQKADMVCCGYAKIEKAKIKWNKPTFKVIDATNVQGKIDYLTTKGINWHSVWAKLYKKSTTQNFCSVQMGEDFLFNASAILKPIKVVTIPYVGYNYFITGNNYSNELKTNEWQNFCVALNLLDSKFGRELQASPKLHYYLSRRYYKAVVNQLKSDFARGATEKDVITRAEQILSSPQNHHYTSLFCGKTKLEKLLHKCCTGDGAKELVKMIKNNKFNLSDFR